MQTIGNQLDALTSGYIHNLPLTWRQYAEDMGNDPARDFGTPDPMGGTDCAHPPIDGTFPNVATTTDQYAIRHVPFLFFHSVIDDQAYCESHVVPLGTFSSTANGDVFSGHLAQDLSHERTTPAFSMVTPNVCNDGHDAIGLRSVSERRPLMHAERRLGALSVGCLCFEGNAQINGLWVSLCPVRGNTLDCCRCLIMGGL